MKFLEGNGIHNISDWVISLPINNVFTVLVVHGDRMWMGISVCEPSSRGPVTRRFNWETCKVEERQYCLGRLSLFC